MSPHDISLLLAAAILVAYIVGIVMGYRVGYKFGRLDERTEKP